MPEKGVRRVAEETAWWEGLSVDFSFMGPVLSWLGGQWLFLVGLLVAAAGLIWLIRYLRRRHAQIQKLWVFILFFLTKRQMLIPLVITLSEKDGFLDAEVRQKLMEIRQDCREVSFKRNPNQRLEIEEQVSKILFYYFTKLDKNDLIVPHTKFAKLKNDLEFIDAKLVQLQTVYNKEVVRWNAWVDFPIISLLCRMIGAAPFKAFK